jgi:hypothetical protein
MRMKHPTTKSIDLGALQATFVVARRQHAVDAKALARAQDAEERSRRAFAEAQEALKNAARTVLA